jgi:hypothetical protein
MSHITRVATTFKDKAVLKAVLRELGYQVEEGKEGLVPEGGRMRREVFDLMITGFPKEQLQPWASPPFVAFQKKGDSYQIVADWFDLGISQRDFLGPLSQRYSLRVARENLEQQGFKVAFRIEERDKSVRLILCREGEQVNCLAKADGELLLTTSGFQGNSCLAATKELEKLLGQVKDRQLTVEGYFGSIAQSVQPEHAYVPLDRHTPKPRTRSYDPEDSAT